MIPMQSTLTFIEDMSQETGVKVVIGVNAYLQEPIKNGLPDTGFRLFIDPTNLTEKEWNEITRYAKSRGLMVEESWNDWGRFLTL